MHELNLNTTQTELAKKYLSTLNGIFRLTEKEKDIVAELIIMGNPVITRDVKKKIRINLNVNSFHLNNYLGYLRKKKIIVNSTTQENNPKYILNPKVFVNTQDVAEKFSININFNIK